MRKASVLETYDGTTDNLLSRKRNNAPQETFGYDNLDRLVSVKNGSRETMMLDYAPNGNILFKTGVGNFSYDKDVRPHAVTAVDNASGDIPGDALNTSFNDFGKIEMIEDAGKGLRMDFAYGPGRERWYSELSKNGTDMRTTVYAGEYEKITENGKTCEFYYLDGNTIVIRENGVVKTYLAFTDNLGSILSVMDENGTKVFDASYDAWGRQTVALNTIGLHRGYTGHEMLAEFDIINMNQRSLSRSGESNGRLYDPVLGRFFSPDNYVQMPDNSQNFNRYSYCLNNPLKYTDPSGNLFGIDDAAIAMFCIGSSMMQAAYEGKSVWKAGALSLLSSAVSYGIGSAFGKVGSFGHELLRAGVHGLASGVLSSLDGGSFFSSFVSGAAASGMGSFAQGVKLNSGLVIASTTAMGGVVAWAMGGDFLQGAMQGMMIGLFNHTMHDDDDKKLYEVLPDGSVELNEVVIVGHRGNGLVSFRSDYVRVTFDRGADHPIALGLSIYLNNILYIASQNGIHSVNISSTSNHPSNATRSAHSAANGSRAIDINYINGQHVSPENDNARYLQNLIRSTPGYLENYGPFIINKAVGGKVVPAPWARTIRGGHYDHIHISIPK